MVDRDIADPLGVDPAADPRSGEQEAPQGGLRHGRQAPPRCSVVGLRGQVHVSPLLAQQRKLRSAVQARPFFEVGAWHGSAEQVPLKVVAAGAH